MAKRRRHGEGSVYQRSSDGKWLGVANSTDPSGRRIRRTIVRATERQATQDLRVLIRDMEGGALPSNATVGSWIQYWLDEIVAVERKPTTVASHTSKFKQYIEPAMGAVQLSKLAPEHVRHMHSQMRLAGLSSTTIKQAHAILRAALSVAEREGKVRRNAAKMVPAPSAAKRPHEILAADQSRLVLDSAADERELCRLVCALMLGMRQGEALGLLWSNVTLAGGVGEVSIMQTVSRVAGKGLVVGTPKSDSSIRKIPLFGYAATVFSLWRDKSGGRGFVFPGADGVGPEGPERDHRAWKAALKRAGVPAIPLHGARGSGMTLLQSRGVPDVVISDILGHADVRTSQRHYLRSDPAQRLAALEQMSKALGLDEAI